MEISRAAGLLRQSFLGEIVFHQERSFCFEFVYFSSIDYWSISIHEGVLQEAIAQKPAFLYILHFVFFTFELSFLIADVWRRVWDYPFFDIMNFQRLHTGRSLLHCSNDCQTSWDSARKAGLWRLVIWWRHIIGDWLQTICWDACDSPSWSSWWVILCSAVSSL